MTITEGRRLLAGTFDVVRLLNLITHVVDAVRRNRLQEEGVRMIDSLGTNGIRFTTSRARTLRRRLRPPGTAVLIALALILSACGHRSADVGSGMETASAATDAPNTPATPAVLEQARASVTKGDSAVSQATCPDAACAQLVLDVRNFPAGTYTVRCWETDAGSPSVFYTADGIDVPADGSVRTPCYYGYPGRQVRLEVVDVYTTPWLTW